MIFFVQEAHRHILRSQARRELGSLCCFSPAMLAAISRFGRWLARQQGVLSGDSSRRPHCGHSCGSQQISERSTLRWMAPFWWPSSLTIYHLQLYNRAHFVMGCQIAANCSLQFSRTYESALPYRVGTRVTRVTGAADSTQLSAHIGRRTLETSTAWGVSVITMRS